MEDANLVASGAREVKETIQETIWSMKVEYVRIVANKDTMRENALGRNLMDRRHESNYASLSRIVEEIKKLLVMQHMVNAMSTYISTHEYNL